MTSTDGPGGVALRLLEEPDSHDARAVDRLTRMVNEAYASSEQGLWLAGFTRTTAAQLAGMIADRQLAVAVRDGDPVGCVRMHDVAPDVSELGMLAADPDRRGTGVGRALVEFVERHGRDRGLRAVRLELLVPRTWRHPHKEFLAAWYGRRGYRLAGTTTIEEVHPQLAPLLATPCDLLVYEKPLRAPARLVTGQGGPARPPAGS